MKVKFHEYCSFSKEFFENFKKVKLDCFSDVNLMKVCIIMRFLLNLLVIFSLCLVKNERIKNFYLQF